jgi:hypothetical protein
MDAEADEAAILFYRTVLVVASFVCLPDGKSQVYSKSLTHNVHYVGNFSKKTIGFSLCTPRHSCRVGTQTWKKIK